MFFLLNQAAWAGGGGGTNEGSMILLLIGLLMIAIAYLLAHFVVDKLQKRYLFVSGIEYIALGLGLSFLDIFHDKNAYLVAITFALGWLGLLHGLEGDLRNTLNRQGNEIRLAIVEVLVVGLGIGGLATVFFHHILHVNYNLSVQCGMMMGCAAAASSRSAVEVVSARYPTIRTALLPTLKNASQLSNILAIIAFGILVCLFHEGNLPENSPFHDGVVAASSWAWITLGIGGLLGILFTAFLGRDADADTELAEKNRFLALTGIICFAAGAAFLLKLSVLAVTLFLGMFLANARFGKVVQSTMESARKPAILILLVFAGVLLHRVPMLWAIALCGGFLVLRVLFKAIAGWLAAFGTSMRGDIFRGHLAQGEVALGIAISFRLVFESSVAVDLAYTAIVVSVAFNELIGPRFLRGLLVDAGEIRQDLPLIEEQG